MARHGKTVQDSIGVNEGFDESMKKSSLLSFFARTFSKNSSVLTFFSLATRIFSTHDLQFSCCVHFENLFSRIARRFLIS